MSRDESSHGKGTAESPDSVLDVPSALQTGRRSLSYLQMVCCNAQEGLLVGVTAAPRLPALVKAILGLRCLTV